MTAMHDIPIKKSFRDINHASTHLGTWIVLLPLAVLLGFLAHGLSAILRFNPAQNSTIWLPGGLLLAIFLLRPYREWAPVAIGMSVGGTLAVMRIIPVTFAVSMAAYFVAIGIIAGAAWILRSRCHDVFRDLRSLLTYFLVAVLMVPAVTALTTAYFGDVSGVRPGVFHTWMSLAPGHSMGFLVVTPLILALNDRRSLEAFLSSSRYERFALFLALAALSFGLWSVLPPSQSKMPILLFAPIPLLAIIALRLGVIGACLSVLLASVPAALLAVYQPEAIDAWVGQPGAHLLQCWALGSGLLCYVVAVQRTQQSMLESRILEKRRKLQGLAAQVLDGKEDERKRISRELHDGIHQQIAAIANSLVELRAAAPANLIDNIDEIKGSVGVVVEDLRRISRSLHPSILDRLGLVGSLESFVYRVRHEWRRPLQFVATLDGYEPKGDVALCIYRVTQEAVNNAVRHADATQIVVHLREADDGLVLEVVDDGKGFDAEGKQGSMGIGLLSMEERALKAGAKMAVVSKPGLGTLVRMLIPRQA